jgi:hypothetical protein
MRKSQERVESCKGDDYGDEKKHTEFGCLRLGGGRHKSPGERDNLRKSL